jgi:hypothetical protein
MKRIWGGGLWTWCLLSITVWVALGVTRWLVGPAFPDIAVGLLAVVGGLPAYVGILAAAVRLGSRTYTTVDFSTSSGFVETSAAFGSHPAAWTSGHPVTTPLSRAPEREAAAATGPEKLSGEAGQGLRSALARGPKPARFFCNTCRTKRDMDDLAVAEGRDLALCVACQAREGGYYRPVPESLAQAVRAILEGTAEL